MYLQDDVGAAEGGVSQTPLCRIGTVTEDVRRRSNGYYMCVICRVDAAFRREGRRDADAGEEGLWRNEKVVQMAGRDIFHIATGLQCGYSFFFQKPWALNVGHANLEYLEISS